MKIEAGIVFALLIYICVEASPLYASANLQLVIGGRSSVMEPDELEKGEDVDERTLVGREYGASFLFVPVPKAPFAIGMFGMQQDQKIASKKVSEKTFRGFKAGATAMAWFPLGVFQPYLKVGVNLYSRHSFTMKFEGSELNDDAGMQLWNEGDTYEASFDGKLNGYSGAIGFKLAPIPRFAIIAQAEFARERFKAESTSIDLGDTGYDLVAEMEDDAEKMDISSVGFVAGLEFEL